MPVVRVSISASPIFSETFSDGGSSIVARAALAEARILPKREANSMLSRMSHHLGMHADRELVDERPAVGAGHVDRPDLAIGERFDRGIERKRNAEAAREQVHRAGGQYRQRLLLAHQRRRGGRNRSVAAAGDHHVGAAAPRPWQAPPRSPARTRSRCRRDGRACSSVSRHPARRTRRDRSCGAYRRPGSRPR